MARHPDPGGWPGAGDCRKPAGWLWRDLGGAMTRLEALSEAWAREHGVGSGGTDLRSVSMICAEEVAFEAGFCECRKMAADIANVSSPFSASDLILRLGDEPQDRQACGACPMTPAKRQEDWADEAAARLFPGHAHFRGGVANALRLARREAIQECIFMAEWESLLEAETMPPGTSPFSTWTGRLAAKFRIRALSLAEEKDG